jgi:hypothetical protein
MPPQLDAAAAILYAALFDGHMHHIADFHMWLRGTFAADLARADILSGKQRTVCP